MATIRDVAQRAGVSIATVSSVANGSRPVAPETEAKVRRAMEELGYTGRAKHRREPAASNRALYVAPSMINPVFAHFSHAVLRAFAARGYDALLWPDEGRTDLASGLAHLLATRAIQGVIVTQATPDGKTVIEVCHETGTPVVVLLTPERFEGVSAVTADDRQGAEQAVEHLLRLGHREIGLCMVPGTVLHERRLEGYTRALEKAGLHATQERVIRCTGHDQHNAFAHVTMHLKTVGCNFTGLLCCNDMMAFGAVRALEEFGAGVPGDVSVIGYDDSVGRFVSPPLTTVSYLKSQMAESAVNLLLEHIGGETEPRRIVFPQELVVRESTAARVPVAGGS